MTKTFDQHADEAQMSEADRIAHECTWNAAIQAVVTTVKSMPEIGDTATAGEWRGVGSHVAEVVRALATE